MDENEVINNEVIETVTDFEETVTKSGFDWKVAGVVGGIAAVGAGIALGVERLPKLVKKVKDKFGKKKEEETVETTEDEVAEMVEEIAEAKKKNNK